MSSIRFCNWIDCVPTSQYFKRMREVTDKYADHPELMQQDKESGLPWFIEVKHEFSEPAVEDYLAENIETESLQQVIYMMADAESLED